MTSSEIGRGRWRRWVPGVGRSIFLWVSMFLTGASVASAQSIFVANHDFEAPGMLPGGFTTGSVPGWVGVGGSAFGVFRPTVPTWGYVAPEGGQLLYSNGPMIEQVLSATAQAGERYVLAVDVVNRPTYGSLDYTIELWAGTTLLGFDDGTLSPPIGGSLTSLIAVEVAPGSPAVGQPFVIRLGGPTQVNFDDVRLLPEPSLGSVLFVAAGLPFLARRNGQCARRVEDARRARQLRRNPR